ncbi:MAG: hypothetical protein ACPGVH_05060 [Chitinophagales bacterium]
MSNWKLKSVENIESANSLIAKSKFCSSVHCSYYSNVQLMYHILRTEFKKTDSEIAIESKEGAKKHKGSHNWLINYFVRQIGLKEFMAITDFNNFINELKNARIKADYKNELINKPVAKKCIEISIEVTDMLTKYFKT